MTLHNFFSLRPIAVVSLLLALGATLAHAQSSVMSGRVTDSNGAVITSAAIEIENTATGIHTIATTNGSGYYQFPPLAPGAYILDVKVNSFAESKVTDVQLEVGSSREINITLRPAKTQQSVTVTATAPELVTDNAERGNVIESQFVENTPLNIRNPLQLVNFAQGVTPYNSESGNNDQSEAYTNTFRINGGRLSTTESLLDGGTNTTPYDYNAIASVPQVDSLQEFKVLTDAYAPEWGRTSGGIVTFATKSGTDHLHGSVFEYIRNSYTDANSFNADENHTPKPHFERNQFGFALGGPVAFPPHYHDAGHRTFFFVTYEGLRQSQAGNFTYTVPTPLERQGDFSQSFTPGGTLITIYDPHSTYQAPVGSSTGNGGCTATPTAAPVYCRTPFQGNKILPSELDAAGMKLINSYPNENQAGTGLSSTNNFFSASPTSSIQNTVNFRFDHRFNDRHSIFAHYDWFQRFNYYGDPYGNGLSPVGNHQRLPGDNTMLNHTWVLSPSLVFQHFFVYTHQESNRIPNTLGFDPTSLGFNSSVTQGLPSTTFPEIASASRISPLGPQSGLEADGGTTFQYAASLTYLRGRHSLKFGIDYRFLALDYNINQLVSLTATSNFSGGANALSVDPNSGSGIADLLLGTGAVTSGIVPGYRVTHPYYAGYAQDEYHLTPKLTVTYGLRYSIEVPDSEVHNQLQYIDLTSTSPLSQQVTALGGLTGGAGFVGTGNVGSRLQTTQYKNFDPRLGLAYRVNDKTVVRGGFGIFHAPAVLVLGSATSQGFAAVTTSNPALANGVTPQFNMDNPFPSGLTQVSGNSLGLDTNAGLGITGYPRKQSVSYSNQWSFDVQRQLPYNFVVTAGYVGNSSVHLYTPINFNQLPDADLAQGSALLATVTNPFYGVITNKTSTLSAPTVRAYQLELPHPQFTTITEDFTSFGHSSYEALQLTVERRFSEGLAILFAYTHSKTMDNVGDYFTAATPLDNHCLSCDRSISPQDLRDVIRLSVQYELPFGHGKPFANHGLLAATVGGWSLGSFFTYDDGAPVSITAPSSGSNTNTFGGGASLRPNVTGISTAVPGGRHIAIGTKTPSEFLTRGLLRAARLLLRRRAPLPEFHTSPRHEELRHARREEDPAPRELRTQLPAGGLQHLQPGSARRT